MRLILFSRFVIGILLSLAFLFWPSANGQYFEDPTQYFQKFEFDMMNRGTFNTSKCLTDLLTCFELVKPDVICTYNRYFETVCPTNREVCHDYYGNYDIYGWRFHLQEEVCKDDTFQKYT